MLDTIVRNVETAIQNGRTDVMLALIDSYHKSNEASPEKDALPLSTVLNSLLTDSGTFLHFATKLNQSDIVRSLLLSGADPTVRNGAGCTGVDLATTSQMRSVYEQELMRTVAASDIRRSSQLLNAGLGVNCQDSRESGNTPLHWAVTYADVDTINFLLDKGADANAANCLGVTPLHDAVVRGDSTIVQELLGHGANISARASHGKYANLSPMNLAKVNSEILTILQDHSLSQSPDIDLEQNSDTSSSWANECGSRESLITVEGEEETITSATTTPLKSPLHPLLHQSNSESNERRESPLSVHNNRFATLDTTNTSPPVGARVDFGAQLKLVWPAPIHLDYSDETMTFPKQLTVYCVQSGQLGDVHQIMRLWRVHERRLTSIGVTVQFGGALPAHGARQQHDNRQHLTPDQPNVLCHVQESLFASPSEAYRLSINATQMEMVAGDLKGLFYATCLLVQLLEAFNKTRLLPVIRALDWPEWRCRGILIKICPNSPSLNMASIQNLLSTAVYLRINHLFLQLKLSNRRTLALPFTPSVIMTLDGVCQDQLVVLTPSVELDESLAVTATLHEVVSLIADYLTCFTSKRYLYVGPLLTKFLLKSTRETGCFPTLAVSQETCLILDATYVDSRECDLHQLPLNASLLNQCQRPWNNQDLSNFQKKAFKRGLPRSVMLCTSLANSLVGLPTSLYDAWRQVCANGGRGEGGGGGSAVVILDPASSDKLGVLPLFQWPGLLAAAGLTWNSTSSCWPETDDGLADLLDCHVFNGHHLGLALLRLARVDGSFGGTLATDGHTFPYQLITRPDTVSLDGLTAEKLQKTVREIKAGLAAVTLLAQSDTSARHAVEEIYFTADLLLFCYRMCRSLVNVGQNPSRATGLAVINVGVSNLPPTSKTDLANRLLELRQRFQKIWLTYHLPDGFHVVLRTFHVLLHQLIPQVSSDSIIEI